MSNKLDFTFTRAVAELIIQDPFLYQHAYQASNGTELEDAMLDLIDDFMQVDLKVSWLVYKLIGVGTYHVDWDQVLRLIKS